MFVTVELEPGYAVDVKFLESGLVYVMQNHDGSTVYSTADRDTTYPDYQYNEADVLRRARAENH